MVEGVIEHGISGVFGVRGHFYYFAEDAVGSAVLSAVWVIEELFQSDGACESESGFESYFRWNVCIVKKFFESLETAVEGMCFFVEYIAESDYHFALMGMPYFSGDPGCFVVILLRICDKGASFDFGSLRIFPGAAPYERTQTQNQKPTAGHHNTQTSPIFHTVQQSFINYTKKGDFQGKKLIFLNFFADIIKKTDFFLKMKQEGQ